jgi:RNA polymerase sigma factor (sigma-70 family)
VAYVADTRGIDSAVLRPRFGQRQPPAGQSERELVARVHNGDDWAFEALYDAYHLRLLTFCRHMLGSREEAEDVLQHTFLAAYRSLRAGYEVVELKPWLYTIARNRCLSVMRRRREEVELDEGAPATEGLAAEVDRRADLRMLVRDVQRLPPDQRAALVLFEVGDHSHKEIAAVLGVRREKVKALVFQARETLMGWRTARETPCATVREQLETPRGRALGRGTIRRHVELCTGCADYEAAVRCQRAALAIALPVVPAAGLRAAVLGSAAGGSGLGAAVGAGGATSAAGGLAGLGASGVAAKVLLVGALVGGIGVAGHAGVQRPQTGRAAGATPAPHATSAAGAPQRTIATAASAAAVLGRAAASAPAPAQRPASKPVRPARGPEPHRTATVNKDVKQAEAAGKAAAPGQLKAPGTPAQGKALGHDNATAHQLKPARATSGGASATPKPARANAVSVAPAKAPKPVKAPKPARAPKASNAPEAAGAVAAPAPDQSAALPPGQAKKRAEAPKKP